MTVAVQEETALVRIEALTAAQLFQPEVIDPILDAIRTEVCAQAALLDISTEANRKALNSLAFKVTKSRTFIESQRKSLVEGEKRRLKVIDTEGKRIWDELETLQDEVRQPLTDWEDAEKARVAAHEASLTELIGAGTYTLQNWQNLPLEAMRDRLNEIKNDTHDWQEFIGRAKVAVVKTIGEIKDAIARRETLESERAELEKLRSEAAERAQREREEAIAKAAREKAEAEALTREQAALQAAERERQRIESEKFEAEAKAKQAEAEKAAAIEKAEQDRIAAEGMAARAAAEAEQARLDAIARAEEYQRKVSADHAAELERIEQKRVADERAALEASRQAVLKAKADQDAAVEAERQRAAAEQRRIAAEAEARAKDKAHKSATNREIMAALIVEVLPTLCEAQARNVIVAIASGKIPHVTINY